MSKSKRITDIVCLITVAVLFASVVLLNTFQTDRPTVSETEKRALASFPEFSWDSLKDGSYFSGISAFISDTFIARDTLVGISREMDVLKGVDYAIDGEDSFVLLAPVSETAIDESIPAEDDGTAAQISAAFDALLNTDASTGTSVTADISDTVGEAVGSQDDEIPETVIDDTADIETETEAEEPAFVFEPADEEAQGSEPEGEPGGQDEGFVIIPADEDKASGKTDDTPEQIESVKEPEPEAVETKVTAIHLSKTSLSLTVGSGGVVTASIDTNTGEKAKIKWSISDKSIATISMNPGGGIDVKAVAVGTCQLICKAGDDMKEVCTINVSEISVGANPAASDTAANADFITDGMFILGDAVYTQAFYSATNAGYYAQTAAYYKQLFGSNTTVSVVVAPVSSMVVDNPNVVSKIPDQKGILDKMKALMDPSVNFVDAYSEMYEHRSEYLFFKSDHHWTQRGAYHAYRAFAESIGLTPAELSDFDYGVRNESYSGSMYNYTYDARVKNFTDVIEAFYPRKKHTMTVTASNGATYSYDTSIVSVNKTYVTFIAGDNPYTVINVPENPQDKNILVLKDSFGNAFVPFLCEHFGNIIVVDVRYSTFNIYNQLKDYGITDIVFVNNIQAANSFTWSQMYLNAVGVKIG